MNPSQKNLCVQYYKSRENGRAPSNQEVRLLNALASLPSSGIFATLSELYTNDAFVAVTYADMMNKRRELHPQATSSVSLREAFGMASAYLNRSGKTPALIGTDRVASILSGQPRATGDLGIEGSKSALRVSPQKNAATPAEGDLFVLIHRGSTPMWKYRETVDVCLSNVGKTIPIKCIYTVPAGGLLPMLLSDCTPPLCYRLCALSLDGYPVSPDVLVRRFEEYRVVLVAKEHAKELTECLSAIELRPMVFAAVTRGVLSHFIKTADGVDFSFETDFLRRLLLQEPRVAKLASEKDAPLDRITTTPITTDSCAYLHDYLPAQRLTVADGSFSAAHCDLKQSFFRSALQTTLAAILSLVAGGGDYTQSRLVMSLTLPSLQEDEQLLGNAISTILGIYRVQCELGIPAAVRSLSIEDSRTTPSLDVFAHAPNPTLPSRFEQVGNSIYCVSPLLATDELPDFSALRHLLATIAELNKKGAIKSARVLCGEILTDAVLSLSENGLTCHFSDRASVGREALPLAILLESAEALPFVKIGSVVETSSVHEEVPAPVLPCLSDALNKGEQYEAILFAAPEDAHAKSLAAILGEMGVLCAVLTPSTAESELVRATLTAQLLILCPNASLPSSPAVRFALKTLTDAKGVILSLCGGDRPDFCPVVRMETGISGKNLIEMFQNREIEKSF